MIFRSFFTAVIYPVVKVHRRGGRRTGLGPALQSSSVPLVSGLAHRAHGSGELPPGPGHQTTARGPACEPSKPVAQWDPEVVPGIDPELFQCRLPENPNQRNSSDAHVGGDEETRTPDPLLAKEMLFQLSYVPVIVGDAGMVGVSGLEPETSALSGQCSNQLS